jgi:hypothetical protein
MPWLTQPHLRLLCLSLVGELFLGLRRGCVRPRGVQLSYPLFKFRNSDLIIEISIREYGSAQSTFLFN